MKMNKKIYDFANKVADSVDIAVKRGDYRDWLDMNVEVEIPDTLPISGTVVVWGEGYGEIENYFLVYIRNRNGYCATVFSDSCSREDLIKAVACAVSRMLPEEKKPRKGRPQYRKGGPVMSLDELARQEFVFFHEKLYHHGWFGSWQLRWCACRIKFGEIFYAVKESGDGEADTRC